MLQKYQILAQLLISRQYKTLCVILPTLTPFHNTFHKDLWPGSDIFGTRHKYDNKSSSLFAPKQGIFMVT